MPQTIIESKASASVPPYFEPLRGAVTGDPRSVSSPVEDGRAALLQLLDIDYKRLTVITQGAGFPIDGCLWEGR
jgi:hypothetical protein